MKLFIRVTLIFVVAVALAALAPPVTGAESRPGAEETTLLVWAGDQARTAPDFLAVVDFDERSATYGKVLSRVELPGPGASNNEPHHVGLSADGNVLAHGSVFP